MSEKPAADVLARFRPHVVGWFRDVFREPTAVQREAWEAISAGENALVVAPTGSGKTLAAFLWAINQLADPVGQTTLPVGAEPGYGVGGVGAGGPALAGSGIVGAGAGYSGAGVSSSGIEGTGVESSGGVKVLYISPLKALGVDVQRNLRAPLTGINHYAAKLGMPLTELNVAVRSGDTTAAERRAQVRRPPGVLITTPESAYLMLTSKAGAILKDVHTVIIDEIHALAGTKRGVHLALTLERLEALTTRPPQRIGLSATVRPLDAVAKFLGGDRPVEIINPAAEKSWDLAVHIPVEDLSDLPTPEPGSTIGEMTIDDPLGITGGGPAEPTNNSIWPFIEAEVYREIMAHRSTLVFVNSRRSAERLTSKLNELHEAEHPDDVPPARAHHGSVSKEERERTETMLKQGELKAVVSTSSLELGIDMGAVELVIQVESPPSVASGLQRVGRAGHVVGATSHGSFYPKHRADLVDTAVIVQRMRRGEIEELQVPKNALDVLLQQTVAAVAVAENGLDVEQWYSQVTRAYPYRDLAREVFDSVIDLASGVYPSTDFAELRPRVNFDRITGILTSRPGAQRVAVTSGGTIPDRGMFGVYLVGGAEGARRVGELDEEMVYESRVGDIFTLGASSWRVEEITRDQVLVSPAPGRTGQLPFWRGDDLGRPAELGRAIGAFRRLIATDPTAARIPDLDHFAQDNLARFIAEQKEATGVVPDEQTLVLERFRDEVGDWRIVLHTPYGRAVNAAWALAVGSRIVAESGMDAQPVASDDGIVLRLPEQDRLPGGDLFLFDPDEAEDLITGEVGGSALFASRFRECAARALLLPRRNPGKRAPLWQQRQKAAQLLDVAKHYPSFPIILETVRECLQDVYDLPALRELLGALNQRRVRIVEVETPGPSPFASAILFNYTGAFIYEGDSPLAERRAAALSLDPALLAKLLGTVELRELLSPEVIEELDARLRRVSADRMARTPEELADTLRILGPVPIAQVEQMIAGPLPVFEEALGARVMRVRIAGVEHLAQSLDAALLRDALGVPVPPGVAAQVEPIADALYQLLSRWSRTRGPFVLRDVQEAFGLAASVAHQGLAALVDADRLVEGHYRQGVDDTEYVDKEVLRQLRVKSLALARARTAPVSQTALARFSTSWQQVTAVGARPQLSGADGVYGVCEQLAGVRLPASAWESLVFPLRVANYSPVMLDELTSSGEILVVGAGRAGANDPWVMLLPADYAAELIPLREDSQLSQTQEQILGMLAGGGGFLAREILGAVTGEDLGLVAGTAETDAARDALWGLFEAGLVSPDGFAPIRARLAMGGRSAHRAKRRPNRSRLRAGRTSFARSLPPDVLGRWSLTVEPNDSATARSVAHGEAWLDRYGVVTRGAVVSEDVTGGFALAYRVLSGFEASGKAMRGLIVDGLGAAQFSTPAVIDRLRGLDDSPEVTGWPSGTREPEVFVLPAVDPANPYGAALDWPQQGLSRAAGALVVLADGLLIAHLTRGGRSLTVLPQEVALSDTESNEAVTIPLIVQALRWAAGENMLGPMIVEKLNGEPAFSHPYLQTFREAGAGITPKGIRIT